MLLIDKVREETGMPMKGIHIGRHVGWTTQEEKALKAQELGCSIQHHRSPWTDFQGWEVTLHVGSEA